MTRPACASPIVDRGLGGVETTETGPIGLWIRVVDRVRSRQHIATPQGEWRRVHAELADHGVDVAASA